MLLARWFGLLAGFSGYFGSCVGMLMRCGLGDELVVLLGLGCFRWFPGCFRLLWGWYNIGLLNDCCLWVASGIWVVGYVGDCGLGCFRWFLGCFRILWGWWCIVY